MLKPLHDHVVLKKDDPEKKTKSGIILTTHDQDNPTTASVVAVGPGTEDHVMSVKEGDTVVYKSYATTEVTINDTTYLIIKESDILAIMEG